MVDDTSPDYPDAGVAARRNIDNSCLTMPNEGNDVIGVTAVAPGTQGVLLGLRRRAGGRLGSGRRSRDGNVATANPVNKMSRRIRSSRRRR